jgi:hypothetical protein
MHGRVGVEWKGRGPSIHTLVKRRECTQSKEKVSVIEAELAEPKKKKRVAWRGSMSLSERIEAVYNVGIQGNTTFSSHLSSFCLP